MPTYEANPQSGADGWLCLHPREISLLIRFSASHPQKNVISRRRLILPGQIQFSDHSEYGRLRSDRNKVERR